MVDYRTLRQNARDILPEYVFEYFDGVADGGESVAEAEADWNAFRFLPRIFGSDVAEPTATTVLGTAVSTPVLIAPMAQQTAADPEGERATARAARRAGSLLGVSTMTSVPFAEIGAVGAPWWYQLYLLRDPGLSALLMDRAVAAGARAIILTLDMPALNTAGRTVYPTDWPNGEGRELSNITPEDLAGLSAGAGELLEEFRPEVIATIRERTGLPVVVKGIMRPADARTAVDAGASAVVVSTHGGRRIGRSVTSARALAPIVAEVGSEAEVYVDSGLRNGESITAALALGARAVFVGRPAMFALAAQGEQGVFDVIDGLTTELSTAMAHLGARSLADLTPDMVATPPAR